MNPKTGKFEPLFRDLSDGQKEMLAKLAGQKLDNPKFDKIQTIEDLVKNASKTLQKKLVRANGEPVPRHWPILRVGELVTVKDITMKVVHINECTLVLEPEQLEIDPEP